MTNDIYFGSQEIAVRTFSRGENKQKKKKKEEKKKTLQQVLTYIAHSLLINLVDVLRTQLFTDA